MVQIPIIFWLEIRLIIFIWQPRQLDQMVCNKDISLDYFYQSVVFERSLAVYMATEAASSDNNSAVVNQPGDRAAT